MQSLHGPSQSASLACTRAGSAETAGTARRWSAAATGFAYSYYRIFFHARNGNWNQDMILKVSCWLAATRYLGGGPNVSAFRGMPITPELQRLIDAAGR